LLVPDLKMRQRPVLALQRVRTEPDHGCYRGSVDGNRHK
jgi:hypothetical protein